MDAERRVRYRCWHDRASAYCEAKYDHVAWGDVEHILPKSNDRTRLLDYDNLTVACPVCNVNKRNHEYKKEYGLLDPFEDDPEAYIYASGTMMWPHEVWDRYVRAKHTIDDIDLNRTALIDRRKELLEECHAVLREYSNAPLAVKEYAKRTIQKKMGPDSAFSIIAKAFFVLRVPEVCVEAV